MRGKEESFHIPGDKATPHPTEPLGEEGSASGTVARERCEATPWSSISRCPGISQQPSSCLTLTDAVKELEASREDANRTVSPK